MGRHQTTGTNRLIERVSFSHLVRGPEEVAAERHHPALVGLLQQLGRILGRLRGESIVVGGVKALARE